MVVNIYTVNPPPLQIWLYTWQ